MATVALSTLRSRLQTFLRDTEAKKWSADDLTTFINLAITKWTSDLPIATSTPYTIVSGQHEYTLPDNATSVDWVYGNFESSATPEYLAPMQIKPGMFEENDEPRRFVIGFPTDSQFYLPRTPIAGTTFTLYYGAKHSPLSADSDTLNLRQYAWGELAVLYYAAHLCYMPYAASRARLEQWARRQDLNVQNPLAEQSLMYKELYDELMTAHAEPIAWEFVRSERA